MGNYRQLSLPWLNPHAVRRLGTLPYVIGRLFPAPTPVIPGAGRKKGAYAPLELAALGKDIGKTPFPFKDAGIKIFDDFPPIEQNAFEFAIIVDVARP